MSSDSSESTLESREGAVEQPPALPPTDVDAVSLQPVDTDPHTEATTHDTITQDDAPQIEEDANAEHEHEPQAEAPTAATSTGDASDSTPEPAAADVKPIRIVIPVPVPPRYKDPNHVSKKDKELMMLKEQQAKDSFINLNTASRAMGQVRD